MTFFTSYPNKKSLQLSFEGQANLNALNDLWVTQSWQEAVALAERVPILQRLGIQEWLNNTKNWNAVEGDNEKHTRLLSYAREKMLLFWHGYHQHS